MSLSRFWQRFMDNMKKVKKFAYIVNSTEDGNIVVTRPMCGNVSQVEHTHNWLKAHATRTELDFPKIAWWLNDTDIETFKRDFGKYIRDN